MLDDLILIPKALQEPSEQGCAIALGDTFFSALLNLLSVSIFLEICESLQKLRAKNGAIQLRLCALLFISSSVQLRTLSAELLPDVACKTVEE
ncbi:MAG: hypothetical protein ACRDL7_07525 [Gaiellaceae bacterium]